MPKIIDLTGKKIGKLTVLYPTGKSAHNGIVWRCRCDCGQIKEVETYNLTSRRVKSCGCGKHEPGDYTGIRRGQLTGVRRTGKTCMVNGTEKEIWEWECSCGARIERPVNQVYPRGISKCPNCRKKKG